MNDDVLRLLERLGRLAWFSECGKPSVGENVRVSSLAEARAHYAGKTGMRWENFKLAIMNRQGDIEWERVRDRRDELQRAARVTDHAVEQFVNEHRHRMFSSIPEDDALRRMVRLDLGWITSEIESPLESLNFFSTVLLPVYEAGHMPCGWRGQRIAHNWQGNSISDLPKGRLVVF